MGRLKNKPNDIVYDFYEVNQNGKPAPVEESPLNFLGGAIGGGSRGALKYMRGGSPGGSSSGGTHTLGTPSSRVNRKGAAMSTGGMNVPEGDRIDPMTARDNMMANMTARFADTKGGDEFQMIAAHQSEAKTPAETISPTVPLNGHQASQMNAADTTEEAKDPVKSTGGVTGAVNIPKPAETPTIPEQGGSSPATGSGKRYILTEE